MSIWMLEDPIQKANTYTWGPFQLFLLANLFIASENSKKVKHKKPTKRAIEVLLNEIFTMDLEQNEKIIQQYIEDKEIKFDWVNSASIQGKAVFVYLKLLTLDAKFALNHVTWYYCRKKSSGINKLICSNCCFWYCILCFYNKYFQLVTARILY